MTNKFLKTFGICVMVILLPVLIVVSAVCLREDINQNNNSYTVYSEYADETKLEYKEGDNSWVFISIPVRKYYEFVGVKVDGVEYAVVDKKVQLADDSQKDTFKKAVVEDKKPINAVWECEYSKIYLQNGYSDLDMFDHTGKQTVDLNAYPIEKQGLFTWFGYAHFNDTDNGYSTSEMESIEIVINGNTTNTVIAFTVNDLSNINGNLDITIKTILDKLEEQGITLNKGTNKEATIKLVEINFAD